jgi:NTE family protein
MPRRAPLRTAVLAWLLAAATSTAMARPTIGLVLGGGGARGAAHIGVLEVLERLQVPVDCVAGTSFGALVAGAWAAGVSPAEMRRAMAAADWDDMFRDDPAYTELNYRNKRLQQRYLPGSETGVGPDGVDYPPGAVSGQKIKLFINQLVRADRGEREIQHLPIPLSIVATDIGNGERVVLRSGSLTQAMRASMSVPGLVAPLDLDGRKLVDGGLVDNLPVQEVRDRCGAEVVIAVNVGSPLLTAEQVGSLLSVTAQMVALLTEQNVTRSLQQLGPSDIYIKPVFDNITAGDFARFDDAAARGSEAAEWVGYAVGAHALDAAAWQQRMAALRPERSGAPRVDEIRIEGMALAQPAVVSRYIGQPVGEPLDTARLNRDLMRAYGDGWYQSVDYSLLSQRDRRILRITPVEKSWGPDYLRLALNLDSTLDQGSSYSLRAAYQQTWINRLGGELLASAEIGSRTALEGQWYQPLEPAQRWFGQLDLALTSNPRDLYVEDQRVASFDVYRASAELSMGVNLRLLGQLRAGVVMAAGRATVSTGPRLLDSNTDYTSGGQISLDLDQLDRLYFPTSGWALRMSYFRDHGGEFSKLDGALRAAVPLGSWVLGTRLAFTGSPKGQLPVFEAGTLGGFLNLSAYGSGQFVADTVQYGHLRAERIIGRAPLGLRGDMRLGLALEVGRTSSPYSETQRDGVLDSLAIYLGGETPFGPVYLGLGASSAGSSNAYLFLGTP